jgi:basic membrane protein A
LSRRRFVPAALAVAATAIVAAAALVGTGSAAPTATIKAGLVSDVGKFNDKGFNQLQLEGLNRAKAQLHVQTQALQSNSPGDYTPNFTTLARQNFNIIIGAGFLLAANLGTVAKQFPNIQFAITDDSTYDPAINKKGPLPNVAGLTYATQENSYMAGCLAALMTQKQGGKTIGVVGGIKIPPVDSFLAGYRAGAQKCVPGTKVLIGYSNSFTEQDKCKVVALQQIAAGSQVEFNVAGPCGFGTLNAAKEKHVWGIGVDTDQSYLGPHILTSVVKHVEVGVFDAIKDVQQGQKIGGKDLVFDLKNGGVGIGKISPKVPKAFIAKMNALKGQIISGKIKPPSKV